MNIASLVSAGASVQIVCSVADLKELFLTWLAEHDAQAKSSKEDRLLSADEAAKKLGVTAVTLWRWAKVGYLTPVKTGRKLHYWQSDVELLTKKEA